MSFRNGAMPAFFAAVEYLSRLLPRKTTSLFSFFPNSTIDFSRAMWDENVVTIIPAFLFWIVRRTSWSSALAIFSDGVFLSEPEYSESTTNARTPSFAISLSTL